MAPNGALKAITLSYTCPCSHRNSVVVLAPKSAIVFPTLSMSQRRSARSSDRFPSSSQDVGRVDVSSDEEEQTHRLAPLPRDKGSSQGEGGYATLSESQQDELVKRLIRLMICRNARKRPVRRDEMTRYLFANMGNIRSRSSVFKGAFAAAQHKLRTVFGMEMIVVEKLVKQSRGGTKGVGSQSAGTSGGGGSGMKGYILVSVLPAEMRAEDERGKAELGFLVVVAGMIALEGGCRIEQESLYRMLERLGCGVVEKGGHKQLNGGNVKELLEKVFVAQWYLEREKEDMTFYYTIGPRFRAEVADEDLIGFIDAVYGLGGDRFSLDEMSKRELKMKLENSRGEGLGDGDGDMDVDE